MKDQRSRVCKEWQLIQDIPEVFKVLGEAWGLYLDSLNRLEDNHIGNDKHTKRKLNAMGEDIIFHVSEEEGEVNQGWWEVDHVGHEDFLEDLLLVLFPKQVDNGRHLSSLEQFFMIGHSKHPDQPSPISILEEPVHVEKLDVDVFHGSLTVLHVRIWELLLLELLVNLHSWLYKELTFLRFLIFLTLLLLLRFVRWACVQLDLVFRDELRGHQDTDTIFVNSPLDFLNLLASKVVNELTVEELVDSGRLNLNHVTQVFQEAPWDEGVGCIE